MLKNFKSGRFFIFKNKRSAHLLFDEPNQTVLGFSLIPLILSDGLKEFYSSNKRQALLLSMLCIIAHI